MEASSQRFADLFNLLDHPVALAWPRRLHTPWSFWHEHIPFAMFLMDVFRPRVLVELGAHYGTSYCAFCQALDQLVVSARCYAVDSWEGDPNMGEYGDEVLADLRKHHDPLYGASSTLIQATFDEALGRFEDRSIDLLHIDGFHKYEAVKHDFETWLPKVSTRGLVLMHDTNVRDEDYGVYRFFEELKTRYRTFEFLHGSGLGIVAVGTVDSPTLQALFNASPEDTTRVRDLFAALGQRIDRDYQAFYREKKLKDDLWLRTVTVETHEKAAVEYDYTILKLEEHTANLMKAYEYYGSSWIIRLMRALFRGGPGSSV